MEGTEVDVLERQLLVVVATVVSIIEAIVTRPVKASFTTPCNKMVLVKRLDICAHLIDPLGDHVRSAVLAARQVSHTISTASWLVRQLPRHDGRRHSVAFDNLLDVLLVRFLNGWDMIELTNAMLVYDHVGKDCVTYIVMVLVAEIGRVDIHATIVGPVVCQSNDELHASFLRSLHDFVERY